jgi:phage shock protein C
MTQIESGSPSAGASAPQAVLRRSTEDKMIFGVCGGLGQYFNTDPLWFRMGFVLITLAGGAGVVIYLIATLLMPLGGTGEVVSQRQGIEKQAPLIGGLALVAIGMMILINNLVPWFDKVMWPLALVIAGAGLIFLGRGHDNT